MGSKATVGWGCRAEGGTEIARGGVARATGWIGMEERMAAEAEVERGGGQRSREKDTTG
jgi:hypothetical protein